MPALEPRKIQQKVKHQILREYLAAWGGIIINGLRRQHEQAVRTNRSFRVKFVYVDCFSYQGRYADEDGEPVFGSPIIGVKALDDLKKSSLRSPGFSPDTCAILLEENLNLYKGLLNTLELEGYSSRVKHTDDFTSLKDGEIAVIHGNSLDYVEKLVAFTSRDYTWSFYDLDTYGPSGVPMHFVSPIVSQLHTDALINLPYLDLHRKTGPAARQDQNYELNMRYHDAMYAGQDWREIAKHYYDADGKVTNRDEMESKLITFYKWKLREQDSRLVVKRIPLEFPDRDRTLYYLFLTTHDPTGALELNEILSRAEFNQHILKEERRITKDGTQPTLFDLKVIDEIQSPTAAEADIASLAQHIYDLFRFKTVQYRTIINEMADTLYFRTDIEQALRMLKRKGLASFATLKYDELVKL